MKINKVDPKFVKEQNPRVGLITLASDFRIEKDFNNVIYGKNIDLYSNRIQSYNPLTNDSLKKMAEEIPKVVKNILPNEKLDCIAYGCTSGTIAAGYNSIYEKINLVKPNTKVTTPITSILNDLKILKVNKLSIFTPYTKEINQSLIKFFDKKEIEIVELSYFDIASDIDIGKVDPNHLFDVISKKNLTKSDALFDSCTALPVLSINNELEKKLDKIILSSNQALIWDTLRQIGFKEKDEKFGELLRN